MEHIREVKITVYIDTNKRTLEKEFTDADEAREWLDQILESIER